MKKSICLLALFITMPVYQLEYQKSSDKAGKFSWSGFHHHYLGKLEKSVCTETPRDNDNL